MPRAISFSTFNLAGMSYRIISCEHARKVQNCSNLYIFQIIVLVLEIFVLCKNAFTIYIENFLFTIQRRVWMNNQFNRTMEVMGDRYVISIRYDDDENYCNGIKMPKRV